MWCIVILNPVLIVIWCYYFEPQKGLEIKNT